MNWSFLIFRRINMKFYAIDQDNNCVNLDFKSEQEADEAFNSILSSMVDDIGEVVDSKGKSYKIFVSKGYSRSRTEILYFIEPKLSLESVI